MLFPKAQGSSGCQISGFNVCHYIKGKSEVGINPSLTRNTGDSPFLASRGQATGSHLRKNTLAAGLHCIYPCSYLLFRVLNMGFPLITVINVS